MPPTFSSLVRTVYHNRNEEEKGESYRIFLVSEVREPMWIKDWVNKETAFIEVSFENVEQIVIPIDRLLRLEAKCMIASKLGYENIYNEMVVQFEAMYFHMQLSYESENELVYQSQAEAQPLGMFTHNPLSNCTLDRPHIFGRLLHFRDVVSVLGLSEEKQRMWELYLPWDDSNQYENGWANVNAVNGVLTYEAEMKRRRLKIKTTQ